jgi:serine-type D-Ala-D-Ala carboxypeptidase/endopeptidase (penicillin-binding protein 4)
LHLAVAYSKIDKPTQTQTLYSVQRDSLIIPMLVNSDNMLAEQLMLLCSHQNLEKLSNSKAIENVLSNQLDELPQKPRWVDGSGLSRYNLFTPQDLVFLLQKMKNELGLAKLNSYLPSNGINGTMKSFAQNEPTFLYAKSGSMSGVYNLAGVLETASGKTVIFAVMNNNFTTSVSEVRKETEEMLVRFRDRN